MTPQERKEKHYGFMKIAARQLIDHRNTGYSLEDIARDCGNFANAALAAAAVAMHAWVMQHVSFNA